MVLFDLRLCGLSNLIPSIVEIEQFVHKIRLLNKIKIACYI